MKILLVIGISIIVFGAWSLIVGLPVMWLWNWLMPSIFSLPKIGFLQAVGLVLLSSCLLGRPNASKD